MKRIVLLLAALCAAVYILFFDVAVPSAGGWEPFMNATSLTIGLFALAITPCFKERPYARAGMFSTSVFFLLIHPAFLTFGTVSWLCMVLLASIFIAALLEPINEFDGFGSFRHAAAAYLALLSASGGVLYLYGLFEDVSLWYVGIIQVFLFLLALLAAPWGQESYRHPVRRSLG